MRFLLLYQTDNGQAASLVEAADAVAATGVVDAPDYALVLHEGQAVPDVYDTEGNPITLNLVPSREEEANPEPEGDGETAEEPNIDSPDEPEPAVEEPPVA